jgi:dTDP-4-amino-4,6-dideoxygalactose transaminase
MQVPFLDLKAQHKEIENEVLPMVKEVMENTAFIGGPQVSGFEREFAEFCDTDYCVGVNSGTDALRFALMSVGVGPGDEVITVPNTFIATTEAISQAGGTPVFVDVYQNTSEIDISQIENKITERTKAIIPVHLYGQPADMDAVLNTGKKYNIEVIEDSCQAHGALYKGKKAGSLGRVGCFSFYPGKNLGAYGEGGAIVTQEENIANKIKMIRDHGQIRKYYHELEGYNGRLDAIQAGVLRIKLRKIDEWNKARRRNASLYNELLGDIPGVELTIEEEFAQSVYHLYVILTEDRDGLQKFLGDNGIATGLHYPVPLHLQRAYGRLGYKKRDFPVAENLSERLLSLPMYPQLTHEQIKYVAECIEQFMKQKGSLL